MKEFAELQHLIFGTIISLGMTVVLPVALFVAAYLIGRFTRWLKEIGRW